MEAQLRLRTAVLWLEVMKKPKSPKVKLMLAYMKTCSKEGADGERIFQFTVLLMVNSNLKNLMRRSRSSSFLRKKGRESLKKRKETAKILMFSRTISSQERPYKWP
jgi:hypothetical protein